MDVRDYTRGRKIDEGKTKKVYRVTGYPGLAILQNKRDTTAHNDKKYTRIIQGKDIACTTVTSRIFELLAKVDIPLAFVGQFSPTEILVERATPLKLEVICRRIAFKKGSYIDRRPWESKDPPGRFHRLITEFFLKTTEGRLEMGGKELVSGLTTKQDDPIIINPYEEEWELRHPHKPLFDPESDLGRKVNRADVLGKDAETILLKLDELDRKVFLFIEGLFMIFGYRLADFKIEFGFTKDGCLVLIDVIDPDSWRLQTWDWIDFDKQSFRDGLDPKEVGKRYDVIARMAECFRIPRQALVVWRASDSDRFDFPEKLPAGVELVKIEGSGHKKTYWALEEIENIQRDYPDGGAIIAKVGRSNGLGPVAAAHTTWPVMSVSADWKEKPQNIWSSLDMASSNPHGVFLYDGNAIQAAYGILAQKNPAVYMDLQYALEGQDTGY